MGEGTPGKRVNVKSVSRVRIPSFPHRKRLVFIMKKIIIVITLVILLVCPSASAQKRDIQQNIPTTTVTDTMPRQNTAADSLASDTATAKTTISDEELSEDDLMDVVETKGLHKELKRKFIEGNAGFMSLVALALVLGLAFCIERIIYLTLSEINAKKFMADIDAHIERGDIEGAKNICRETRATPLFDH